MTAYTPNRKRHMVSNSFGYTDPVPLNCHLTSLANASLCSLRLDISPAKSGSCRLPWLRQCQIGFSITRWLRRRRYATLPYCSVVLRYCFPRYSISKLIFATLVATLHTSSPTSAYATPPPRLASLGVSLAGLSPAHLRGIRRAPCVRSSLLRYKPLQPHRQHVHLQLRLVSHTRKHLASRCRQINHLP